jgi:hypothetical protein
MSLLMRSSARCVSQVRRRSRAENRITLAFSSNHAEYWATAADTVSARSEDRPSVVNTHPLALSMRGAASRICCTRAKS